MKRYLPFLLLATFVVTISLLTACNHAEKANANALNAEPSGAANTDSRPFATREEQKKPAAAKAEPIVIPAGTDISVSLQSAVSSATSRPGDQFDAVLAAPLKVDDKTVAPAGTAVTGRVVNAEKSGRLEHPGVISVSLVSMSLNGRSVPLSTSTVSAKGQSHKGRNVKWIAGSAAGGALLGGLLGGGKGALIGSAAGAGGGTAVAAATGKKDVSFGVERRLNFRLTQSVTVQQ
jgi:hypothetical protein